MKIKEIFQILPWLSQEEKENIIHNTRMMKIHITPFTFKLMEKVNGVITRDDPILLQFIPYKRKLKNFPKMYWEDENDIQNGYQDKYKESRIIFRMTQSCVVYCNAYCFEAMRTIKKGKGEKIPTDMNFEKFKKILGEYKNTNIQEIILSGGDPLSFSVEKLERYLSLIKAYFGDTVLIRINTRAIVFQPDILSKKMREILEAYQVTLGVHISHPNEISRELEEKLKKMNINKFLQFPLLRGINDDVGIIKKLLFDAYQKLGLSPNYMYHTMPETIFSEYRVPFEKSLAIAKEVCSVKQPSVIRPQFAIVNGKYGKFFPDLYGKNFSIEEGGIYYKNWDGRNAFYPTKI